MKPLAERLAAQQAHFSPLAVPIVGRLGRSYPDGDDATRGPFQRDRDRILHSQAFRRLQGKTQVFVAGEGDHYRTRLTHTLEVAQISRDIARTMALNEDLAECIALAHDLGHPPFGHSGEEALDEWMQTHGLSFEHNLQSHRIVTVLETLSTRYPGINVNLEVQSGILKHTLPSTDGKIHNHPLEAQIVNLADEIAYMSHDSDDGLRAELFSADDLSSTTIGKRARLKAREKGGEIRNALLHMLVDDLYDTSEATIAQSGVQTLDDVEQCSDTLIKLSPGLRAELDELRGFMWTHLVCHPEVAGNALAGKKMVGALCMYFYDHPTEKILDLQAKTGSTKEEAVKDYVAGMTDEFARLQATEHGLIG